MQPVEELRYLILAAQREGNRIFMEVLSPLGLTPSQAEVLRMLQEYQPLSLIALGDLLVCERGSPSRLVNGLVEKGFVQRLPSTTNGRMVELTLTEQGEEMGRKVSAVEGELYTFMIKATQERFISESIALLRSLVKGLPAGEALALRQRREDEMDKAHEH